MIPRSSSVLADRYVPFRKCVASDFLSSKALSSSDEETIYSNLIGEEQGRCLSFSQKKTKSTSTSSQSISTFQGYMKKFNEKKIDLNFVKTLEANQIIYTPGVSDNFYGHVLDWSSKNTICIALGSECFIFRNQFIDRIDELIKRSLNDYCISSIKFNKDGTLLFAGDSEGKLTVIDLETLTKIRQLDPHSSRIGCIQNSFDWGFLTGSKDCSITHNDLRIKNSVFMRLVAHKYEVCGITLQNSRVASGGKDGNVLTWSLYDSTKFQNHQMHSGAVKALQWCPWRNNILASGGGNKDHKVIIWNPQTSQIEEILKGSSQTTGLSWRQQSRDFLIAHGGMKLQSYISIYNTKIKQFTHFLHGHKRRIVGLALSPIDKGDVCTLGADQTMRFWKTRREAVPSPRISQPLSSMSLK